MSVMSVCWSRPSLSAWRRFDWYLLQHGVKVQYLHSDVDTLRRVELLRELRLGTFDVLVSDSLLREAWTCEVSLVAILDAR